MLICSTFVSSGPIAHAVESGTNNCKVVGSRLIRTRSYFYLDYLLVLSSLRTFIELKMLFWSTVVSSGPLAQSVERSANKRKVPCSRLIRTRFHFLFELLSLFK